MSPLTPRRAISISLAAGLVGGALVGFSFAEGFDAAPASTAVAAAELDRAPLPAGSQERGPAGVERTAIRLAAALDAVPVRADGDEATRFCAPDDLRVRWTAPLPGEFAVGGHVDPVGPQPTSDTVEVNGLVVCQGASFAYMGFEARWDGQAWALAAVPALSDEHDLEHEAHDEHEDDEHEDEAHEDEAQAGHAHDEPVVPAPRKHAPPPAPAARGFHAPSVGGIDPYAAYDPQRVCDPTAKPGTAALRDLLLRTYPGSRSLGVSRTCSARGTSEHKEGRAFDWGVNKGVASERAAAEDALAQLLATDSAGHRHALARRLGVMYLIWDRQIWSAYSASRGWRPYGGANAHTDHVHISLSWDGAMGRTSYWSGANATLLTADPELRLAPGSPPVGGGSPRPDDADGATKAVRWTRDSVERTPAPRPSGERRQREEHQRHEQPEARQERDPIEQERWAQERALRVERRELERAERAERRGVQQAERAARRAAERREPEDRGLAVTGSLVPVTATPTDVQTTLPKAELPKAEPVKPQRPKAERPKAEPVTPQPVKPQRVTVDRPEPAKAKRSVKAAEPVRAERPPKKVEGAKPARTKQAPSKPAPSKPAPAKGERPQQGGKGRG